MSLKSNESQDDYNLDISYKLQILNFSSYLLSSCKKMHWEF